jgi:hypothetical protein
MSMEDFFVYLGLATVIFAAIAALGYLFEFLYMIKDLLGHPQNATAQWGLWWLACWLAATTL